MFVEARIVELLHQKIARSCVAGEWDLHFNHGEQIPNCRELLLRSATWCEDSIVEELFLLSAMVCADEMSLYRVDTISDPEYRAAILVTITPPDRADPLVCLFTAFYSGEDTPDPDPTLDPFYLATH